MKKTIKINQVNTLVRNKELENHVKAGIAFKAHQCRDNAEHINACSSKIVKDANKLDETIAWMLHLCEVEPVSEAENENFEKIVALKLADICEATKTLLNLLDINQDEVVSMVNSRKQELGGFEDGMYLDWVEE